MGPAEAVKAGASYLSGRPAHHRAQTRGGGGIADCGRNQESSGSDRIRDQGSGSAVADVRILILIPDPYWDLLSCDDEVTAAVPREAAFGLFRTQGDSSPLLITAIRSAATPRPTNPSPRCLDVRPEQGYARWCPAHPRAPQRSRELIQRRM